MHKGEFSLDGEDNLITTQRVGEYRDEDAWIDEVARYAQAINDVMEHAFSRLFHDPNGPRIPELPIENTYSRPISTIRLREVEHYLELVDEDPLHLVRQLEPILVALGATAYSSTYELAPQDDNGSRLPVSGQMHGNSRSVTVELSNKTKLVVYAKTNRRVRFEIQHRIDRQRAQALLGSGSTFDGRDWNDEFRRWMECLRNDASRNLSSALTRFWRRGSARRIEGAPVYEFLTRVCHLCENEDEARRLISILANNGRIVPSVLPDHLRLALNRQAQWVSPIFVRVAPRALYVEAPRYAAAVEWMRAQLLNDPYGT